MKKDSEFNLALTIFGINFAISPIFSINIDSNAGDSDIGSDYGEDNNLEKEILKIPRRPRNFHLNHSWSNAKAAKICTNSGTYSNPNTIEDLVLNRGGAFL